MSNDSQTKFLEELSKLEENIKGFIVRFNELTKENTQLKNDLLNLRKVIDEMKLTISQKDEEIRKLKVEIENLKNSIVLSDKERKALKSKIAEMLERIEVYLTN